MCSTGMSPKLQKNRFSIREMEQTRSQQTSISPPSAISLGPRPHLLPRGLHLARVLQPACSLLLKYGGQPAKKGSAARHGLGQQLAAGGPVT